MPLLLLVLTGAALASPLCPTAKVEKVRAAVRSLNEPPAPMLEFQGIDGRPASPPPPSEPLWKHFDFSAMAISDACDLPLGLRQGLDEVPQVPPERVSQVVMRALTNDPATLLAMCGTQGPGLLASAGMSGQPAELAALVDGCKAPEMGFASRTELLAAPLVRLVSAMTLNRVLTAAGDPAARPLSRLLLGLSMEE